MYDLIIRGGTIVDGTGGEPYLGDVAVQGERIVAVGEVTASARREIDAAGMIVTPAHLGHLSFFPTSSRLVTRKVTPHPEQGNRTSDMGTLQ